MYGKRAASESIWYGSFSKVRQKFDRVCRTFVGLNLHSTHGAPSKSDFAPVSLQSRTYSNQLGSAHHKSEPGLSYILLKDNG